MFFQKYPKDNYKRIVFLCDGYNDLCLVRALDKNDFCLLRKNYDLYRALFIEKVNVKTKCKFYSWVNGFDIVNILEKIRKN
jgi:hypothetical protein